MSRSEHSDTYLRSYSIHASATNALHENLDDSDPNVSLHHANLNITQSQGATSGESREWSQSLIFPRTETLAEVRLGPLILQIFLAATVIKDSGLAAVWMAEAMKGIEALFFRAFQAQLYGSLRQCLSGVLEACHKCSLPILVALEFIVTRLIRRDRRV